MRIIVFAVLFISVNCDPCRNLDCIPQFDYINFTYRSLQGDDLLSGPTKKYELEDFNLYSFDNNQTKVYAGLSCNGSIMDVYLGYNTERSFVEINGVVTDTLDFKFDIHKTECCGVISTIEETKVNGVTYLNSFPIELVERN